MIDTRKGLTNVQGLNLPVVLFASIVVLLGSPKDKRVARVVQFFMNVVKTAHLADDKRPLLAA